MTVEQAIQQLSMLQKKSHALKHASGILFYDGATVAPEGSSAGRGETLGILSSMRYEMLINSETEKLLQFLKEHNSELTAQQARETEVLIREYEKTSKIPQEEFVQFQILINEAQDIWRKAKTENNFPLFAPYIQRISETLRKFASYFDSREKPYNVWLDQYERGLNMDKLDNFFGKLKETIVPLLKKIQEKGLLIDDSFIKQDFPIEQQKILSDYLMEVMSIDRQYCAIGESEHPFTINFNNRDVRITTKYHIDDMTNSMYSVIHEGGHALYELHTGEELQYTCLAEGISMGVHESQSRLFENFIGRSEEFINFIYPKLLELFPEQLKDVSSYQFYLAVNKIQPGLIRIEADELTYCLHIMVRYEIEKMLLEGSIEVEQLPETWNRLMKEYLGVDVPDDTHGVLQDTHWSGGSMGYFPSYAIGTAYAAQIMHTMRQDLDVDNIIASGDLKPIVKWLREKIYRFGSMMDPDELLENCCGQPFNPEYYTNYLTEKFSRIYDL